MNFKISNKGFFLAFCFLMVFLPSLFSKDRISTISGKLIECKVLNTDSANIYFSLELRGRWVNTSIQKNEVKEVIYNLKRPAPDTVRFKTAHLFSISTGYSHHVLRDDAYGPIIFRGSAAPIYLDYRYLGTKSRQTVSLFFNHVMLQTDIPNSSVNPLTSRRDQVIENQNLLLGYSYNRLIYSHSKYNLEYFVGGKFNSLLNFRSYPNSNCMTMEQINSLGICCIVEKRFFTNNDFLSFSFHFPIVAYSLWNNIYSAEEKDAQLVFQNTVEGEKIKTNPASYAWPLMKGGEFITLNKFVEIQTELSYTKFITKRIGLNLRYSLMFYSFTQYKDLYYTKYLNTQLLVGLTFKL